jgi:hypothetical protein
MTAIDPFTTPAEAEREARVKQAHDLLGRAFSASHSPYGTSATSLNYVDGVGAVRDALVGQGHAMLAVRDELADIAASLRTLAALPPALYNVAEQVQDLGNDLRDVHTIVEETGQNAAAAIRDHTETVNDALGNVAEVIDRIHWWQLRRRWFNRRQRKSADARIASAQGSLLDKLDDGLDVEAGLADVYERADHLGRGHDGEFRLDLSQGRDPWDANDGDRWPLPSRRFRAEETTPYETARLLLPGLCDEAGVTADPNQVHGRLYACDRDGAALWFLDTVFLPGAADAEAPPEGF